VARECTRPCSARTQSPMCAEPTVSPTPAPTTPSLSVLVPPYVPLPMPAAAPASYAPCPYTALSKAHHLLYTYVWQLLSTLKKKKPLPWPISFTDAKDVSGPVRSLPWPPPHTANGPGRAQPLRHLPIPTKPPSSPFHTPSLADPTPPRLNGARGP